MKIVIIGLGSIATKHIAALRKIDANVKIFALRSKMDSGSIEGVQNIHDIQAVPISPDFIIVSNPTNLHKETIRQLTTLGVPLFIEKPAVHSLGGTDELLRRVSEKKQVTYVACNLRFHPCIAFLKNQIAEKKLNINEVNIYCGSYLPDWRPGKNFKETYSANLDSGGGVHLDLFHEMDYACWLFGYPKGYWGFTSNVSSLGINAPDYANYLLSYPHYSISIILNYYRREPKRSVEVLFDTETWNVDLVAANIVSGKGQMVFEAENFQMMNTYVDQMKYFTNCLQIGEIPMNTLEESLEILKISLSNEPIKG